MALVGGKGDFWEHRRIILEYDNMEFVGMEGILDSSSGSL
jgi:hypothetical protein